MWFPGRYLRKSFKISVRGDSGIEIWRRLSLSGTCGADYVSYSSGLRRRKGALGETDHAVVSSRFTTEREWRVRDALVDHAVGEH